MKGSCLSKDFSPQSPVLDELFRSGWSIVAIVAEELGRVRLLVQQLGHTLGGFQIGILVGNGVQCGTKLRQERLRNRLAVLLWIVWLPAVNTVVQLSPFAL